MNVDDLQQFARRDWTSAERAKGDYWAKEYRRVGPDAARRASELLMQHARRFHPGFPSDVDRAADLAHHVVLRAHLDRAARAFHGR